MPRIFRKTASVKKRIDSDKIQRIHGAAGWVDPFPEIHGTLPEKMVYAELSRLGIPFLFLNDIRFQIPDLEFDKKYQADFVFPDVKLIIEVQGAYFHSMQKTIEADAFKFAVYEVTGWTARAWWDYDILSDLQNLVANEPLLRSLIRPNQLGRSSELPVQERTKVDTSKGIRTLNQRRFRAKDAKVSKRTLRKGLY
jgi:hypothetical protein